jgi:hypothetical protein
VEEENVELSDEVLEQLELQDATTAELLQLSLNAIAGTEKTDTICIRALVGNQIMLLLIDSGSSHSFVSTMFATRLNCE